MSVLSSFTNEDKEACLPIIDFLVKCANYARKEGILALEDMVEEHDCYFMKFALMLVVDGVEPFLVKGMLENLMSTENHTGSALLERILITEGVLQLQAGQQYHLVEMMLLSFLGESFLQKRGFPNYQSEIVRHLDDAVNEDPLPECVVFDSSIRAIHDKYISRILTEIETKYLPVALKGCGKATAKKIRKHLSERMELVMVGDLEYMYVEISEILEAQNKIVAVIKRLADYREISLPEGAFDKVILQVF